MSGRSNGAGSTLPATQDANPDGPSARGGGKGSALAKMLESAVGRLGAAMPSHVSPERMVEVARTLVYRTPKLQECDPATIVASVMQAASLGLDLAPAMGEGYLIPRWNKNTNSNECQFQIGFQGVRKLALQSGQIRLIETRPVRERDEFELLYAPTRVHHRPYIGPADAPNAVIGIYSFATLASGEHSVEFMSADDIEAIHKRSEGYQIAQKKGWQESGPWATDWVEMGRKTVLKRHCKSLPRSLELARAIEGDNVDYTGVSVMPGGPAPARLGGTAGLRRRLQIDPPPEPEFQADAGVSTPVYSEAADADAVDAEPEDREPGADG